MTQIVFILPFSCWAVDKADKQEKGIARQVPAVF